MRRCIFVIGCAALFARAAAVVAADDAALGYSATPPADGAQIKTDRGYMVSYKATIPGTDVTFEMLPIPGGKFTMGSPATEANRDKSEGPQFTVEIEPFWIGKYEMTWAQYRPFMELHLSLQKLQAIRGEHYTAAEEVDAVSAPSKLYEPSFNFESGEDPRLPAVTMSQFAAKQYTKWLSKLTGDFYRLPSEAEWEYACRAGTKTAYSFGDDPAQLKDYAWCYEEADDNPTSHFVGLKKPNPWGLHDMHGNVSEWVLDAFTPDGYQPAAGDSRKGVDAIAWPKSLSPRTLRGGSWDSEPAACRSASRLGSNDKEWCDRDPNFPNSPWWFTETDALGVGFRFIRPATPVADKDAAKYWDADIPSITDAVDSRLAGGKGARWPVTSKLPDQIKQLPADAK